MRPWERAKLRSAALRYAEHGWPVVPGAFLTGHRIGSRAAQRRFNCGELGCRTVACHPAVPDWEIMATEDPSVIASWWHVNPYSVLLATGHTFDVLEVPADLGRNAMQGNRFVAVRGPVAVTPEGRWMFLVLPGHGILPELAQHHDVVLHGYGSWVPAPPSRQLAGRIRWELHPEQNRWRPAEPYAVQVLMLHALGSDPPTGASRPAWRPVTWAV